MNIGELKTLLAKYPDSMEVLTERCSDYTVIDEREWSVVSGVQLKGCDWVMRSHPTMSEDNKKNEKRYLLLEGN